MVIRSKTRSLSETPTEARFPCSSCAWDLQLTIEKGSTVDSWPSYGRWSPVIGVVAGGQDWRAIIDTGFNGELELPEQLRAHVNARFVGRAMSLLAAHQQIEEDVFLVDFSFDGHTVRVQATFVEGVEILIGTGMLRDYRLRMAFPARIVVIEPR